MVDWSQDENRKLLLIFLIYFFETIITMTIFQILSLYLGTELGIHPVLIGIVGSVSLIPFVCKVFFGLIMDKYKLGIFPNSTKSYLFIGMLLNGIFLLLFSIDIINFFIIFAITFFLQALGFAIIDVTIDSIAVMLEKGHGVNKNLISVSMFLGTLGGGFLGGFVISRIFNINYSMGFIVVGIISLIFIPTIFLLKNKPTDSKIISEKMSLDKLNELFKNPNFQLAIITAFFYNLD